MRRLVAMIPPAVRVAFMAVMLASMVNFFWCIKLLEFESPEAADGRYVLQNHGKRLRDLTEAEYHRMRAYEVRLFSTGWVVFSLAALVGLRYVAPRIGELVEPRDDRPAGDV